MVAIVFGLHGPGQYSIRCLYAALAEEGLVNRPRRHLAPANMSGMLHKSFYAGPIRTAEHGRDLPPVPTDTGDLGALRASAGGCR